MQITTLYVKDLRNLKEIDLSPLQFSKNFNVFLGKNGSGKTSVLEGIHLLATAQSFRTRHPRDFIEFTADSCVIGGKFLSDSHEHAEELPNLQIGIQRFRKGGMNIKVNDATCDSISTLARLFPFQIMHAETFRLLEIPSKFRRQFLDWGMFHVEPQFFPAWQRYNKALKQRNSALRQQNLKNKPEKSGGSLMTDIEEFNLTGVDLFKGWDSILVKEGSILAENRSRFIESFTHTLNEWLARFLPKKQFSIRYSPGWTQEKSLEQAFEDSFRQDSFMGYTTQGPHRADFEILVDGKPAEAVLSRGQRKLLISALYLARGAWFLDKTQRKTLYLLDDLNAELDLEACQRLLQGVVELGGQLLVTAVTDQGLETITQDSACKMFHVEHGKINN